MEHNPTNAPSATGIVIPAGELSEEIFQAILEQFVLREGTDYGAIEVSLAAKVEQVRRQVDRGEAKIVFDPETQSVTIMKADECPRENHPEP